MNGSCENMQQTEPYIYTQNSTSCVPVDPVERLACQNIIIEVFG